MRDLVREGSDCPQTKADLQRLQFDLQDDLLYTARHSLDFHEVILDFTEAKLDSCAPEGEPEWHALGFFPHADRLHEISARTMVRKIEVRIGQRDSTREGNHCPWMILDLHSLVRAAVAAGVGPEANPGHNRLTP